MIVGIDLGTTNSLIAHWDGETRLVANALGSNLTPSVVSIDSDGEVLVGAAARERTVSHPDMTAAAFKRYMGSPRKIALGTHQFRAEELASFVIRSLLHDATAAFGERPDEAVITVPAYFSDAQRRATRRAGELAGLKVDRVLNEPTAAALAYGLLQDGKAQDGPILVFDLGGGTFDVSVLELTDGIVEVRATAGDNFLGGEDFDDAVAAWFVADTGIAAPDPLMPGSDGQGYAARLQSAARRARESLTGASQAVMTVRLPGGGEASAALTTDAFAEMAAPLLERLRRPVARALADSRIRPDALANVVLAGGATRMPIVRREAARMFGRLPLQHFDPDEVVARGAGVQAGLKARSADLSDVVLTDVAPYTLGIAVGDGCGTTGGPDRLRMLPVIERNTTIPVSRMEEVRPAADFTKRVLIEVFQGEARLTRDNIPLGSFELALSPKRVADQPIQVRFTYNVNGILEVSALEEVTGKSERIVIRHSAYAPEGAEAEARLAELAALKLHPRDRAAAKLLLARAERCYEEQLGPVRDRLGTEIAAYVEVLERQDDADIEAQALQLERILRELDAA
ncbi:MAG: Hsp70 family protein [Pontixanthobacter sp.]